jgi:hypothetical protein
MTPCHWGDTTLGSSLHVRSLGCGCGVRQSYVYLFHTVLSLVSVCERFHPRSTYKHCNIGFAVNIGFGVCLAIQVVRECCCKHVLSLAGRHSTPEFLAGSPTAGRKQ